MTAASASRPLAWLPVSVVVPVRDEPEALEEALRSILDQDYAGALEIVVADGSRAPRALHAVRARYPGVRVVANPDGSTAAGLNRAVAAASHGIVARCDARSVLPPGYLRRAVAALRSTGAANVGGMQRAVGRTPFERSVALAMAHPLGAGDARYRLGGQAGPVDTVYLGVFRRAALEAAGGFDETLERNQDYELNWRLRLGGGTVWFEPGLAAQYRPRGSLGALARQYADYGRWKRAVLVRHPRSLRWRQAAAPLLVLGLVGSAVSAALGWAAADDHPRLSAALLAASAPVPVCWTGALFGASGVAWARCRGFAAALLPAVFAVMHLAWGAAFLFGRTPSR